MKITVAGEFFYFFSSFINLSTASSREASLIHRKGAGVFQCLPLP